MTDVPTIKTRTTQLAHDWVDAIFARKWPTLSAEIAEQHLARGRRGFKKGHEFHPPKQQEGERDE